MLRYLALRYPGMLKKSVPEKGRIPRETAWGPALARTFFPDDPTRETGRWKRREDW